MYIAADGGSGQPFRAQPAPLTKYKIYLSFFLYKMIITMDIVINVNYPFSLLFCYTCNRVGEKVDCLCL